MQFLLKEKTNPTITVYWRLKKKSKTQKFVTLPGIKIDDKLNFKKHV